MKFLVTIFTALVVALGISGSAHATPSTSIPPECAESDTRPDDVECALEDGSYPLLLPESGTVPDTTTPVEPTSGGLPATGTDSTTLVLQMGGVLLIGGLVVLVVARRRSPATAN